MNGYIGSSINLQATLSASSALGTETHLPHHPITCGSEHFRYNEDNSFECAHAKVEGGDRRTQSCVDHSIALMLVNMAVHL